MIQAMIPMSPPVAFPLLTDVACRGIRGLARLDVFAVRDELGPASLKLRTSATACDVCLFRSRECDYFVS
jgi:hypothetical protein